MLFSCKKNVYPRSISIPKQITQNIISEYAHFLEQLPNFHCVRFLKFKGSRYYKGDYIIHEEKDFIFKIKIIEIYVNTVDEDAFILEEQFQTVFTAHLRSYKIGESLNIIELVNITDFGYPPVNQHEFYGDALSPHTKHIRIRPF